MKKMNKILKFIGITLAFAGVLALLGFVGSMRTSASCDALDIRFERPIDAELLTEHQIKENIAQFAGPVVGMPLNQIDTRQIEKAITALPHARSVKVYKTIHKKMVVEVEERHPIMRLIDEKGNSALIADDGIMLPRSANATLRLPIISGAFSIKNQEDTLFVMVSDTARDAFSEIMEYATAINQDKFWRAQIQQTELTKLGDFIAYPQVGMHKINFGHADKIKSKLARLRIFYREGMPGGNWNKFSKINLKYKDQIVCTKK
jgi:cell division protein FtsQ